MGGFYKEQRKMRQFIMQELEEHEGNINFDNLWIKVSLKFDVSKKAYENYIENLYNANMIKSKKKNKK